MSVEAPSGKRHQLLPLVGTPITVKQCCVSAVGESGEASDPIIALVGAPNVGKSTLFNALTGAHVTMGNWPGTTVEVSRGVWRNKRGTEACECSHCTCSSEPDIRQATLIDLPGAYSLEASSPDEHLTRTLVADVPEAEAPDLVLAVVDAAHLARSLYLVAELRERSRRIVLAVTMDDVARRQGVTVDSYALSEAVGAPAVIVDPRRRVGLDHLMRAVRETLAAPAPAPRRAVVMADSAIEEIERSDPGLEAADERFAWVAEVAELGTTTDGEERVRVSDRIDRVALAPVAGPLVFLAIMWLVFQITTTVAAPLQDFLDGFFSGPVSTGAVWLLERVGLGGTWVEGLLVDGLIAGVGMLLTFVPLMILMFILLALLEDSGYLARAAVLTDRVMGALGLPGRAFLPLVVGFGCNVPAIAGTRILPHARQRLLTVLLVPFTSCTARLTVFVMLGAVFFGRWAGTAVFAMYAASILIVVLTGLALRKTLWRTMPSEPLVIDLPPYQAPTVRLTAQVTWLRLKGFLQTASGIIVLTVIGVWLLQAIPVDGGTFGHVAVGDSLYAWLAEKVAPVFDPAGFGQWQTVAALVVGFVAKEAVISSWGQTYAVADPEDVTTLGEHIRAAFEVSSGGHPTAAALAFMIFLLAYTPCLATLAAQKREVGWRWMGFGFVLQLVVAYVLAVVVFQIGRLIV